MSTHEIKRRAIGATNKYTSTFPRPVVHAKGVDVRVDFMGGGDQVHVTTNYTQLHGSLNSAMLAARAEHAPNKPKRGRPARGRTEWTTLGFVEVALPIIRGFRTDQREALRAQKLAGSENFKAHRAAQDLRDDPTLSADTARGIKDPTPARTHPLRKDPTPSSDTPGGIEDPTPEDPTPETHISREVASGGHISRDVPLDVDSVLASLERLI